jgi:hypothetical protein
VQIMNMIIGRMIMILMSMTGKHIMFGDIAF